MRHRISVRSIRLQRIFSNQRARHAFDTTAVERGAHLAAELRSVARIAQAVHDAMLPSSPILIWLAVDRSINQLALSIAAELRELQRTGDLNSLQPHTLANETLQMVKDAIEVGLLNIGPLDFPNDQFLSGAINVIGRSSVQDTSVGFGGSTTPSLSPLAVSDEQIQRAASFTLNLDAGSELTFAGSATFGLGSKTQGIGTVAAQFLAITDASVSPGQSPGTLTFAAPTSVTSTKFLMEVGDTASNHDQVRFLQGVALRNGSIDIIPFDEFKAAPGQAVPLFESTIALDFSTMSFSFGDFGGAGGRLDQEGTLHFTTSGAINGTSDPDVLLGTAGRNVLSAGAGSDVLAGGAGADVMRGGVGGDVYIVDDRRDRIVEVSGGGRDTVKSSVSFSLPRHVEHLTLTGTGSVNGNGNGSANILAGSAGNNALNGAGGNDVLIGGMGRDVMRGASGSDRFAFNAIEESVVGTNRDVVFFVRSQRDKIDLSGIDADPDTFGNQLFRWVKKGDLDAKFNGLDGQLRFASSTLQGDVDGDRQPDFEIRIIGSLTAADVIL